MVTSDITYVIVVIGVISVIDVIYKWYQVERKTANYLTS